MNKKGFTLIEIIIVVIIIGILAAVALPRLTGQMTTSRGAEAMGVMGNLMRQIDTCFQVNNAVANGCNTFAQLGIVAANLATSIPVGNFDYNITAGASTDIILVQACYKTPAAQGATACVYANATDAIQFSYTGTLSTTKTGKGAFANVAR
jgi:prepilin-type N-terminal cleavage/methylation domain-containing protein